MIQNKQPVQCLATFNPQKFQQCLSDERKKKFPFLNKAKVKKLSSFHKIIRQEKEQRKNNQSTRQLFLQNHNHQSCNVIKQQSAQKESTLHYQEEFNRINDPQKLRVNKVALPAVFRANNLIEKNEKYKKRSISSEPGSRNRQYDKKIHMLQNNRYNTNFDKQQKINSIILKKYDSLAERYGDVLVTGKSHQIGEKNNKGKACAANIGGLDPKILQSINKMKKLYG